MNADGLALIVTTSILTVLIERAVGLSLDTATHWLAVLLAAGG